jgi:hypothetical protein
MKKYKLFGSYRKERPDNEDFNNFLESHSPGNYSKKDFGSEKGWPKVLVKKYDCSGPSWSHSSWEELVPVNDITIFAKESFYCYSCNERQVSQENEICETCKKNKEYEIEFQKWVQEGCILT